jgi:hypothetical protein
MPLPLKNNTSTSSHNYEFLYKNRFAVLFIYNDDYYEYTNPTSISININSKKSDNELVVEIMEIYDMKYNFSDIEGVIIDMHSPTGDIKIRKVFDVEFSSFCQNIGTKNDNWRDDISTISLFFEICKFEIMGNIDTDSYIRDRKINKIIE